MIRPSNDLTASRLVRLDFHRAQEAIDEGYAAAQAALPGLKHGAGL